MADARVAQIVARYEARSEGWANGAIAYLLTELATAVRRAETAERDADRLARALQQLTNVDMAAHREAVAQRSTP